VPDLCGKCSACIDHCPTDAILDDRSLDARKCLAYWNIEAKSAAPLEIRDKFEGWCLVVTFAKMSAHGTIK
jgi:epoxyqueuosine reductase